MLIQLAVVLYFIVRASHFMSIYQMSSWTNCKVQIKKLKKKFSFSFDLFWFVFEVSALREYVSGKA